MRMNSELCLQISFRCLRYVCGIMLSVVLVSCSSPSSNSQEQSVLDSSTVSARPQTAADVLSGYWKDYDFHDSTNINTPERGEQSFVDFISLFPQTTPDIVSSAIKKMLAEAKEDPKAYAFFLKQYEKYLYDPNSPVRNDIYYEPVLEFKLDSTKLTATDKIKTESLLALLRKNMPGKTAADFSYVLSTGQSGSLAGLSSPFTILFFYEPGCSHCEEAIEQLRNHPALNSHIANKQLTFLAIYPFGGKEIWKGYQAKIPDNWLNAFDEKEEVLKKGRYDLKATPTIFLLDEQKKVILKDADVRVLLEYLG